MSTSDLLDSLADELVHVHRNGGMLNSDEWANAVSSREEAYAVQAKVEERLGWNQSGEPRAWKCAGNSRANPVSFAALPPSWVRSSRESFTDLVLRAPLFEAEIALRLSCDVTPEMAKQARPEEVVDWVDAMAPAIEVADSRWLQPQQADPMLKLADLSSHGALVLGGWVPFSAIDWATLSCSVTIGDQPPLFFTGTYALGDPTWPLGTWLAHATRLGDTVAAGTVLTTGSWCGGLPSAGARKCFVDFPALGSVHFEA